MTETELSKDDVKIVPAELALWTKVKEGREQSIKALEDSLSIEKEFLKTAESKLKELENGE